MQPGNRFVGQWKRQGALKDSVPVQEQRSSHGQQRRPTVHPTGAIRHPYRCVLRSCIRVVRHGQVVRNCGILGLNHRKESTLTTPNVAGRSLGLVPCVCSWCLISRAHYH